METVDYIVIALLLLVIGGAVAYIIKAKKSGQKCIGCPYSKDCAKNRKGDGGCCSCGSNEEENN